MTDDKDDVDLLIVMGSSLKVGPVNDIPDAIGDDVPRILSEFLFDFLPIRAILSFISFVYFLFQ